MPLPALLDYVSQVSFMTMAKTKAFMLSIIKVQTAIAALGSAKTQRTQSVIVMEINDAVEKVCT